MTIKRLVSDSNSEPLKGPPKQNKSKKTQKGSLE